MRAIKRWLWNLLIALDQLANALLGGDPDETISSRMGKAVREERCVLCRFLCDLLHRIDPNHCQKSIEEDEGL
ncbi:hypothetical protein [Microbulbifer taiwanensis]|uniref:Secreted protein n=1 Tax=Microbulbifer taiwanensis TaxID=986746 RepID=A0ABW1YQ18_9GAMM|nr:hypothetical protein [Microbulbifer taiwanensis]